MYLCSGKFLCVLLVNVSLTVFFFEFLIYVGYRLNWPENKCGGLSDYHKILLVADPQILGENSESWIARWDSDRFLQKTFWFAYWYVRPSAVIFLGDLMDEGSIASEEQYARYYKRFRQIFHLDDMLKNKTIFLPGDNDIGGENERITASKIQRFDTHFGLKPDIIFKENLQFIKINVMLESYPVAKELPENRNYIKVGISHMPVLARPSLITKEVLSDLKPHLIFSAHNHISGHFVNSAKTGEQVFAESFLSNKFFYKWPSWRFQLNDEYPNEILVPTCSYRMGVRHLAYGVVIIDKKKGIACYNILWLPNRLHHLCLYPVGVLILFIIWKLYPFVMMKIYRYRRK